MWIQTFDEDGEGRGAIYAGPTAPTCIMPPTWSRSLAAPQGLCGSSQEVVVVVDRTGSRAIVTDEQQTLIVDFLDSPRGHLHPVRAPGRRSGVPGKPGSHPPRPRRGVDRHRDVHRARHRPRPGPRPAQRAQLRARAAARLRAARARHLQEPADRDRRPRAEEPAHLHPRPRRDARRRSTTSRNGPSDRSPSSSEARSGWSASSRTCSRWRLRATPTTPWLQSRSTWASSSPMPSTWCP